MAVGPVRLFPVTLTVCEPTLTVCTPFDAKKLMVRVAEIVPVSGAWGVNVILMLQFPPGATAVVHPVAVKSAGFAPIGETIVNVSG